MQRKRRALVNLVVATMGMNFAIGCDSGVVGSAARQSIASFLNSVFSTTVNNVLIDNG